MTIWYGIVGTDLTSNWPDDYNWSDKPPEWILMLSAPPVTRPERYGAYLAQADGSWLWQTYPDPPFGIFQTNDGRIKQYQYNEVYVDIQPSATPLLASKQWVLAEIAAAIAAIPTS